VVAIMTYTALALAAVVAALVVDRFTGRVVRQKVFWVAYAIIVFFQLLSNGTFTGFGIVLYDGDAIIGSDSPAEGPPAFVGDGRLAFAPMEDLGFGFALVLLSISLWVWLEKRGLDAHITSGPGRWALFREKE
jgi:hypothetical protein